MVGPKVEGRLDYLNEDPPFSAFTSRELRGVVRSTAAPIARRYERQLSQAVKSVTVPSRPAVDSERVEKSCGVCSPEKDET